VIKIAYYDGSDSDEKHQFWANCLSQRLGPVRLIGLMDAEAEEAEIGLVWYPPKGRLAQLKHIKLIISLGQGVDHLMQDKGLPDKAEIVRLVDPDMSHALSQWVILNLLDHLRDGPSYRENARQRRWQGLAQRQTQDMAVAVYGMGAIGQVIAQRLVSLGFKVSGWTRTARQFSAPISSASGEAGFHHLLGSCDVHICILPLTEETTNLFDAQAFSAMPKGAYFINAGRGRQVVEADLLAAIQSHHLAGACLDVFVTEPLPDKHPFWDEPAITIWPHVAAQTNPDTAADQVARAIQSVINGQKPDNLVDKKRGY